MTFDTTTIDGAFLIRPERFEDDRGFFARTYCVREFVEHGLDPHVVQRSISYSRRLGTLRGMHFQTTAHEENKQISCSRGAIYDVIVDLRRTSPTYRLWLSVTLTANDAAILFVPKGCAHGFLTLTDDAVVQYDISAFYQPESALGVRYDDPAFAIEWPLVPTVVSARDLGFPPYVE